MIHQQRSVLYIEEEHVAVLQGGAADASDGRYSHLRMGKHDSSEWVASRVKAEEVLSVRHEAYHRMLLQGVHSHSLQ